MQNVARERLWKSAQLEVKQISSRLTFETPRPRARWPKEPSNSETILIGEHLQKLSAGWADEATGDFGFVLSHGFTDEEDWFQKHFSSTSLA